MAWDDKDDDRVYKVVVNAEQQYSIWPLERESPPGWSEVGKSGSKADCLAYIKEVWTDMRPLSVRTTPTSPASPTVPGPR
jgi:MbtH protein